MYKITGQDIYLNDAVRTADNAVDNVQFSPGGVLKDEGNGSLFKGILVRYLTQLAEEGPTSAAAKAKYVNFLKFNAEILINRGTRRPGYVFSPNWNGPPAGIVDGSTQLSGVMLMETVTPNLHKSTPDGSDCC